MMRCGLALAVLCGLYTLWTDYGMLKAHPAFFMLSSPEITWGSVQLSFLFLFLTYILGICLVTFPPKPFVFLFWGLIWFLLMWASFKDNIYFLYEPSSYSFSAGSQFYDYWGTRLADLKLAALGSIAIISVWLKSRLRRLILIGFVFAYILFILVKVVF